MNSENLYIVKIANISASLAEVIGPLAEKFNSIDEVAERLKLALFALDIQEAKEGKISMNKLRNRHGLDPIPAHDSYLDGIMHRDTRW